MTARLPPGPVVTLQWPHSATPLTHNGEGNSRGRDAAFALGIFSPTGVVSRLRVPFDHIQSEDGAGSLDPHPVIVPREGGGRQGAGRAGQVERGTSLDELGWICRRDGDIIRSVCGEGECNMTVNSLYFIIKPTDKPAALIAKMAAAETWWVESVTTSFHVTLIHNDCNNSLLLTFPYCLIISVQRLWMELSFPHQ